MDNELKELLTSLDAGIKQVNKGESVKQAAAPPADEIESKGITSRDLDERFADPLRKNFEMLAKQSPSNFGMLGSTKVLDDPYSFLREKDAKGHYKIKTFELDMIVRSIAACNNTREKALANGAMNFDEWTSQSGSGEQTVVSRMSQAAQQGIFGNQAGEMLQRSIDTTSGQPLIRADLEPVLRETFNRYFPAYEMIPKIPANGVKHSWVQKTSPGAASLISELGSLSGTASDSTYGTAQSTNIAVMATYRSIGLKAQYASQQSGMNFNLGGSENNEVTSAMFAIANLCQSLIFQGNESQSGGTVSTEDGAYNVLGFNGLRQLLKGANTSLTKSTETYVQILRKAVGQLFDAGADLSSILMFIAPGAWNGIDDELQQYLRIQKRDAQQGAVSTDLGGSGLAMLANILLNPQLVPAQNTQANGIGHYTYSAAPTEDIYLTDPNGLAMPYLGSPSPTIIQLPLGTSNTLAQVYIPFYMVGLAVYILNFNRKIRISRQQL